MGKGMKALLITACVCVFVGLALLVGVMACGGKDVVAQAVQGGVYFSQDGFHVGNMNVLKVENTAELEFDTAKEMKFSADSFEDLELELTAGTFEIVEGDSDEIIVRSAKKISMIQSGKKLVIDTDKGAKVHFFGVSEEGHHVEITLPKGQEFHTIDLSIGAGELVADTLVAEKLKLELGAGTTTITNCLCETADISVAAGEVTIANGTVENIDLDVAMGELQFAGSVMDELDADCGMGDMRIELPGESSDYNYTVDCGMGDIEVGDSSFGGVASSKKVDNDADIDLDLDCGMGKIEVAFNR
jgi:DUF4097 and DUF4098 domain-containing protein YvlB